MVRGLGGLSQPGVSPLRTWSWATLFKEGKPAVVCRAHSGYRSPALPQLADLCGSGHISESPQLSFLSPASSAGMLFVVCQEHLSLLRQVFLCWWGFFFSTFFSLVESLRGAEHPLLLPLPCSRALLAAPVGTRACSPGNQSSHPASDKEHDSRAHDVFGIHPILSPVGPSDTQVNVFFSTHTVYIGSGGKPEGESWWMEEAVLGFKFWSG